MSLLTMAFVFVAIFGIYKYIESPLNQKWASIIAVIGIVLSIGSHYVLPKIHTSNETINKLKCSYTFDAEEVDLKHTNSSAIYEYGYDECYEKLVIVFTSNEDVLYVYSDISDDLFDDFKGASSLGSFYNAHIKGRYEAEKIYR